MEPINSILFLKQINNVMTFFEQGCEQRNLSSNARNWHAENTNLNIFTFNYAKEVSNVPLKSDQKRFGKIYAGFVKDEPRFWIDATRVEFSDVRNIIGFIAELMQIVWIHHDITEEQFDKLLNRYLVSHSKQISDALSNWIYSSNFEKSSKYGGQLYKYRNYIPEDLKQSPSDKLYRVIEIDQSLFDKIQSGQKKYIELKDRMYSSWSYNLLATKAFGDTFGYEALQNKRIVVILQNVFTPDQIFLNVEKAANYFGIKSVYSKEEFEIIVRTSKSFKFTFKNIHSYLDYRKGFWKKIIGKVFGKRKGWHTIRDTWREIMKFKLLTAELLKTKKYSLVNRLIQAAISKEMMLEDLKEAKEYFDEFTKKYNIPNNWKAFREVNAGFEYQGDFTKLDIPPEFKEPYSINNKEKVKTFNHAKGVVKAGFGTDHTRKLFRFYIAIFFHVLIGDRNQNYTRARALKVVQWLLDTPAQNINYVNFKKAFPAKVPVTLEEIDKLISDWTQSDDYQALLYVGTALEKAIKGAKKILPLEALQLQEATLYRVLFLNVDVFKKFMDGKPLKLKNRKYSSWAASETAARSYADEWFEWSENPKDYVAVVFKHNFTQNDLLINVWEYLYAVAKQRGHNPSSQAREEQESIMKHAPTTFTLEDAKSYGKFEKPWKNIYRGKL